MVKFVHGTSGENEILFSWRKQKGLKQETVFEMSLNRWVGYQREREHQSGPVLQK